MNKVNNQATSLWEQVAEHCGVQVEPPKQITTKMMDRLQRMCEQQGYFVGLRMNCRDTFDPVVWVQGEWVYIGKDGVAEFGDDPRADNYLEPYPLRSAVADVETMIRLENIKSAHKRAEA